jgi:hypothetical protein
VAGTREAPVTKRRGRHGLTWYVKKAAPYVVLAVEIVALIAAIRQAVA